METHHGWSLDSFDTIDGQGLAVPPHKLMKMLSDKLMLQVISEFNIKGMEQSEFRNVPQFLLSPRRRWQAFWPTAPSGKSSRHAVVS